MLQYASAAAPVLLTVNLPSQLINQGVQRFIVAPIDLIQISCAFLPGRLPISDSASTSTTTTPSAGIEFASSTSSSSSGKRLVDSLGGAGGGGLRGGCWGLPIGNSSGGGEEVRLDGQRGCGFTAASSQQVFVVEQSLDLPVSPLLQGTWYKVQGTRHIETRTAHET